jgi:sugar lactone lactonase YvrE
MIVDAEGRCFVGNFGSDVHLGEPPLPTILIRVDPDGSAAVVAEDLRFPNGMAITPDGSTLLVSETLGSRILAFDLDADGGLSGRRIWAQLSEPGPMDFEAAIAAGAFLPDGICLAGEDGIWVADAAGRGVVRVEEGGNLSDHVDTGDYTAYAVVGGEEGKTLFICAGAALGEIDPTETLAAALLSCELDGRPQGGR